MAMAMERYVAAFSALRANRRGDHISSHKPVMLLAVLTLADSGRLPVNRIEYGPELLELFREYFDVVKTTRDQCTPVLPFFYLRGDKFWRHQPLPGEDKIYQGLRDPGSSANLRRVVAHAYLDDELFQIMGTAKGRTVLRDTLINRYFPQHRERLLSLGRRESAIAGYRDILEQRMQGRAVREKAGSEYDEDVRSAAFRRVVTAAYDYRCAACGLRVILDDLVLVDAAHLIPFRESHDDDPCNGMALCKNHHWAMDQYLIAPSTDRKWQISDRLEPRIPELAPLVGLDGKTVLLPSEKKCWPKQESLKWRINRMRRA